MNKILMACCIGLLTLTGAGSSMAAPLVNGDFDTDFNGWSGETTDLTNGTVSVDPDTDPHFSLPVSGGAKLSTDPAGLNFYGIDLFQAFDVPLDVTTIEFDFGWELSDFGAGDLAQVILTNTADTLDNLLLFDAQSNTGSVFISQSIAGFGPGGFAGKNVELLFRLEDADDQVDTITFGSIIINQPAASAPTPTTLALFALGVAVAGWRRRRAAG